MMPLLQLFIALTSDVTFQVKEPRQKQRGRHLQPAREDRSTPCSWRQPSSHDGMMNGNAVSGGRSRFLAFADPISYQDIRDSSTFRLPRHPGDNSTFSIEADLHCARAAPSRRALSYTTQSVVQFSN
ncbi:hypothetical protein WME75_13725 [Sorangium sp. So ce1014]|uniref:hypothetical protein n=1 Tax=Sorangium sp. So ce1014 TaxID=3133326 RepID=UPI003F625D47